MSVWILFVIREIVVEWLIRVSHTELGCLLNVTDCTLQIFKVSLLTGFSYLNTDFRFILVVLNRCDALVTRLHTACSSRHGLNRSWLHWWIVYRRLLWCATHLILLRIKHTIINLRHGWWHNILLIRLISSAHNI